MSSKVTPGKKGIPKRSTSQESTISSTSTGSNQQRSTKKGDYTPLSVQYGQFLFDCSAAVIYCPKHNNFGFVPIGRNKGNWLAYVSLKSTDGWYSAVVSRLKQVLSQSTGSRNYLTFSPPELIHVFRLQMPTICKFVTRVTFFTQLTHDEKHQGNLSCCQNTKTIQWYSAADVTSQNIPDLWGPEPSVFGEAFLQNSIEKGAYTEYTLRDAMKFLPRDTPKTFYDEMLKSANFQEKDVARIYSDFVQHCYPSQYMVIPSFIDYMAKIGWQATDPELINMYRAFSFNHMPYVSFHEFLLGLAAMDKHTHHGGHTGELRCGYIFRYYDFNNDGVLDYQEMLKLTSDILKGKSKAHDDESVEKELAKNYQALGLNTNDPVNETQLLKAIGSMSFRGSSALFRSPFPVLAQMSAKRCYESLTEIDPNGAEQSPQQARKIKGTCPRCRLKKYSLATHIVKLSTDSTIIEPQETGQEDAMNMSKEKRAMSNLSFSADNIANRMLDWLREFGDTSGLTNKRSTKSSTAIKKGPQNFWTTADRNTLSTVIVKLCVEAEIIFKKEPRCVKLNSPCYVLGDIHGNFHDLMIYERILWRKAPTCISENFLFLGDFVDRGDHGLECILYLLSFKIIAPERFTMLRGNHELRNIQAVFTFQRECFEKFGKACGQNIWDSINKVFDVMPICAVIDESIFCAHGGIPTSLTKLEELNSIPIPLPEPENQSPAAWEMLWNDPVSGNEFGEYAEMLRLTSGSNAFNNLQGFLPNTKRGTAYYFSEEAVNKFLQVNNLTHIIRAHEVIPPGYQFHMGGKVITIFSSSRYCGGTNEAACAFVEGEKIRILRLDTLDS